MVADVFEGILAEHVQVDGWFISFGWSSYPSFLYELVHFLRCTEMHGSHVNEQRAFDAAASTFAHASPVLEGIADQCVGRNGGDGLVEVLYFYGGQ